MVKRVGMLTGGGDCPGLNAVIRAAVRRALKYGDYEMVGLRDGWKGLSEKLTMPLTRESVSGILHRGGTILGSSRTNIFKDDAVRDKALANYKEMGLDALIAIGGEDTLGAAHKLSECGYNVIGVPKTIDNDLIGTDYTFGFDTAVSIATEAIDRLHSTAESHHRVLICEVMGRHAGWIALHSGIAGGADCVLIPEKTINMDSVCHAIKSRMDNDVNFSIIVVAEGAKFEGKEVLSSEKLDEFGHVQLGGIADQLAKKIKDQMGVDTRATVLGHIQRGGSPTAYDRFLSTRYGLAAMDAVHNGKNGVMVALSGKDIVEVPLTKVSEGIKTVDDKTQELIDIFLGY